MLSALSPSPNSRSIDGSSKSIAAGVLLGKCGEKLLEDDVGDVFRIGPGGLYGARSRDLGGISHGLRSPCCHGVGLGESDETHLAAQFEPGLGGDAIADLVDHGLDVVGRRPLAGLDEVGVLVGDEGAADPETTKVETIDQLAGRELVPGSG